MAKKFVLGLIIVSVALGLACKSNTAPDADTLKGTWTATKAEFTSAADPGTKADVVALGGTAVLVLNETTAVLTITKSGESARVYNATWSSSTDVLTLTWTSGSSGESQFDFVLDGDSLTMEGGHLPFDFTAGDFVEAILNMELTKAGSR
ncbi:MAG TPA: hypothetical protein VLN41_01960 [Candidatus Bathyarchaeia archaeon]|nr:hypothetical protein [Candidatus Bathyarchaeia archaeon]